MDTGNKNKTSNFRAVWALAWPMMLNMTFHQMNTMVDLYWIGELGTTELAAVSICVNVIFLMFGITGIINIGTIAVVSRLKGANEVEKSHKAASHSLRLGLVCGMMTAIFLAPLSVSIIKLFGASTLVTEYGSGYLFIILMGFLGVFPATSAGALFAANGDTRTPMYVSLVGNVFNAVLDPFLIFGWAGFPSLGVFGAGIATTLSWSLGTVLLLIFLKRRKLAFRKDIKINILNFDYALKIIKIGVPGSIGMIARPLSTNVLMAVIAGFGDYAVASFTVAVRAIGLTWIFHAGISVAVASLVGQALGRKSESDARNAVRSALGFTVLLQIVLSASYVIFANNVIGLFSDDPAVIEQGVIFISVLALSNILFGFAVPTGAALSGAGHTIPNMVIGVTANWVIKLPLAWFLATKTSIGLPGVWWAMAISIVYEGAMIIMVYRKGTWVKKKI